MVTQTDAQAWVAEHKPGGVVASETHSSGLSAIQEWGGMVESKGPLWDIRDASVQFQEFEHHAYYMSKSEFMTTDVAPSSGAGIVPIKGSGRQLYNTVPPVEVFCQQTGASFLEWPEVANSMFLQRGSQGEILYAAAPPELGSGIDESKLPVAEAKPGKKRRRTRRKRKRR